MRDTQERQSSLNFFRLANHALRTPLTVVSGCLTLLESFSEIESDQTTELISKAATRSKESSLITSDMMAITESFLETKNLSVRESDLKFLLLEAFEGYEVELAYPKAVISVIVSEIDFVSALRRIIESSSRWGKISAVVKRVDGKAQIKITDNGPMIQQSPESLFIEFEPFGERGVGIHSLSHVYSYVLLQMNDASLAYSDVNGAPLIEIKLDMAP